MRTSGAGLAVGGDGGAEGGARDTCGGGGAGGAEGDGEGGRRSVHASTCLASGKGDMART